MFSWKPMYVEIGQKLMAYRNRQDELLAWLSEMKAAGIPVVGLNDAKPEGVAISLAEIDPFTFFANFNRGIKNEHRVAILQFLKSRMGLSTEVPRDFDGIPIVNLQKAWFFPYAFNRDATVISLLWDFAEDVVRRPPAELKSELFGGCLKIDTVGVAKLTMGMFWLQPDRYLALDQVNRAYLEDKHGFVAKDLKVKTLDAYLAVLEKIKDKVGSDLPFISYGAYTYGIKANLDPKELDRGFRRYLEDCARQGGYSVEELISRINAPESGGENEITNRTVHQRTLRDLLLRGDFTQDELKAATDKLWVLSDHRDVIRRHAYFKSDEVMADVHALLDEGSGVPIAVRISDFVEAAAAHGYSPDTGPELTNPAQFASVLLSSQWPDQFVDFRKGRWNSLYRQITHSKGVLLRGKHYGHLLLRAGSFAAQLAETPTFREFFGESDNLWTVAGVAWRLKNGPPKEPPEIVSKRYWAGGFLFGGTESKLEEFLAGNYWRHGYPRDDENPTAKAVWAAFDQMQVGDEFAIKGLGGTADLKIKYVGRIKKIHPEQGRVDLEKLERSLYAGKSPTGEGAGNWFLALLEVTRKDVIDMIFNEESQGINATKADDPLLPSKNIILYGPPGTGKTHALRTRYLDRFTGHGVRRFEFTTFHQSYSYEEFVEGIKPVLDADTAGDLEYEIKPGLFRQIAQRANNDRDHDYAIFIDEINRGNIASIFGELITLLEDDKRLDAKHEIKTRLPYSRQEFGVPPNLYVIGTMNTADRSVEALDAALRRRFSFVPYFPDPSKLPEKQLPNLAIDLRGLLTVINGRLERLLDRDHCIGHSYLMTIAESTEPLEALRTAFANKIIPLLEEYFYGDPGKIGLVLGSAFVKKRQTQQSFAKCDGYDGEDEDRETFERADPITLDVEAFQSIYA